MKNKSANFNHVVARNSKKESWVTLNVPESSRTIQSGSRVFMTGTVPEDATGTVNIFDEYNSCDIGTYSVSNGAFTGDMFGVNRVHYRLVATYSGDSNYESSTTVVEYDSIMPHINWTMNVVMDQVDPSEYSDIQALTWTLYGMYASGEQEVTYGTVGPNYTATVSVPVYELRSNGAVIRIQYYYRLDEYPEGLEVGYIDGTNGTTINLYSGTIIIE